MEKINPERKSFESGSTPEKGEHVPEDQFDWMVDVWRPIVREIIKKDIFKEGLPLAEEYESEIKEKLIGPGKTFENEEDWEKFKKWDKHTRECTECGIKFNDALERSLR